VNWSTVNGAPVNGIEDAAVLLGAEQPPAGDSWELVALVDGSDVSARLTDAITVEASEGGARTASFVCVPDAGAVSFVPWIGRPVILTYRLRDAVGDVIYERDVFRGAVELAEYDLNANLMRLRCTDGLQKAIDALDRNSIDLLTPGALYIERGGDEPDGYTYLGKRLETLQAAIDLDITGTLVLTDWAPKATPDLSVTDADIYDGSLGVEVQRGRDAVNKVTVSFGYRYERYHERHALGGWHWQREAGVSFCHWLEETTELPDKAMIRQALESTGWFVLGLQIDMLPPSGVFDCFWGPSLWGIDEELRQQLAFGTGWRIGLRFTQQITEQYELNVTAPASIAQIGEHAISLRESLDNEIKDEAWKFETDKTQTGMLAASVKTDPDNGGKQIISSGDWFEDRIDIGPYPRAQADKALALVLATAAARIADGHRNNAIVWDMPANPSIERYHTIAVTTPRVSGRGKVRDIRHEFNLQQGSRVTTVRLAISSAHGSTSFTPDPLDLPEPPDSTGPIDHTGTTPVAMMDKPTSTQIGGRATTPPFLEHADGFAGNFSNPGFGSPTYPRRFAATAPKVEDASRQAQTFTRAQTYQLAVREDPFMVTAP
jgi:hypothetical protein